MFDHSRDSWVEVKDYCLFPWRLLSANPSWIEWKGMNRVEHHRVSVQEKEGGGKKKGKKWVMRSSESDTSEGSGHKSARQNAVGLPRWPHVFYFEIFWVVSVTFVT